MFKKRKMDVWQAISFGILILYALFLIWPMVSLLRSSVIHDDGQFTGEFFQLIATEDRTVLAYILGTHVAAAAFANAAFHTKL